MEPEIIESGWAGGKGSRYYKNLWGAYKLTPEDFEELWQRQSGTCKGCQRKFAHPSEKSAGSGAKPQVDHNHADGRIRGLLCQKCNWLLGVVQDNKKLLQNLVQYLQVNGEWP